MFGQKQIIGKSEVIFLNIDIKYFFYYTLQYVLKKLESTFCLDTLYYIESRKPDKDVWADRQYHHYPLLYQQKDHNYYNSVLYIVKD